MSTCPVVRIEKIEPHPNADRLEIITIYDGQPPLSPEGNVHVNAGWVVTGKHYREGQLGVYIPPGALLPGYLAKDLWLVGEEKANDWVRVESKIMRGIASPGLFCGAVYSLVRDDPRSVERFADNAAAATLAWAEKDGAGPGQLAEGWVPWQYWRDRWQLGDDAAAWLGVRFE